MPRWELVLLDGVPMVSRRPTTGSDTYSTRQVESRADLASVLAIWRRNLHHAGKPRLNWLYGETPAGRGRCIALLGPDGEAVGSAGLVPRTLNVGGTEMVAGEAIDLAVEPDHRTLGPALRLARAVTEFAAAERISLIYGFSGPTSEGVLRRVGYRRVGHLPRWTRPIRSEYKLRGLLPDWLVPSACRVVDLALRIFGHDLSGPSGGRTTRAREGFDSRFDQLWEASRHSHPIIGSRRAAFLDWRFARCPHADYRVYSLASEGSDAIDGYIVFDDDRSGGVRVADLLARDDRALSVLLGGFTAMARNAGAGRITFEVQGPQRLRRALRRHGYFRRPGTSRFQVRVDRELSGAPDLLDPENWYLTHADRDV